MTELKLAVETERSRIDILTGWLPRIGVALFFLMIGSQKFTDPGWARIFAQIGAGQWFRYLTGVLQVGGAVLVLLPQTTTVGCAMIASTMLGAVIVNLFILRTGGIFIVPAALLVIVVAVGWSGWQAARHR
jgi:putative oxidoreductase